jgi:hypothetical protein
MDDTASRFKKNSRSSIETRLDQLNDKVISVINKNKHLQKDSQISDDFRPAFFTGNENLDLYLEPDDRDLNEDSLISNPFFQRWSELCMKLEDIRSAAMKTTETLNLTENPSSFISEAASVLHGEEIHIKELYHLEKKVKNIIKQVESGETFSGHLKFCNVSFYFHVFGFEFPTKDKLAQIMFPEEFRWNCEKEKITSEMIELRKNAAIPKSFMEKFALRLENDMKKKFHEVYCNGFEKGGFFNYRKIGEKSENLKVLEFCEKEIFKENDEIYDFRQIENGENDWKIWENSKKFRNLFKKCEFNCRALEWQNAETQVMNNHLRTKLKNVLKQEGELNFRSQDLKRLNLQYQDSIRALQEREKKLLADQAQFEDSKKKLEKMKNVINDKIEEINKSIDVKPTMYTSRTINLSPSIKVTKNSNSSSSSESFQNFELSGDSLEDPTRDIKQVKSNLSLKISQSLRSSPKNIENSFSTNRKTQNFNLPKPPIYRRSSKIQNDCSNLAYTKSLLMREERIAEKEAEIARREKEIHDQWIKHPYAQEFIPMIQKEMIRLKELQDCYEKKIYFLERKLQDEEAFSDSFKRNGGKSEESDEELSQHSKMAKDVYSMMEEYFY